MAERRKKSEWDSLTWLHVYGQWFFHSEARIRGTKEGLTALRDALTLAIEKGQAEADVLAADGEGYSVLVQRVNTHAALGEPEYLYDAEYHAGRREMERERRTRAKHQRRARPSKVEE